MRHIRWTMTLLPAIACSLALAAPQADRRLSVGQTSERRVALVIGNDSYTGAPLKNARSDARAIARALEDVGFAVTRVEDATRASMNVALERFGDGLQAGDVALFYFAGHGAQVDNENYLIPVDFASESATGVRLSGLPASTVQQVLGRARVSVLVLDACRNNPFTGQRSGGTGLASMEARGSLIAFATGVGQTASDNGAAVNGLFTQELLKVLREPGLPVGEAFKRVRQQVYQASSGRQFPAVYDGLLGEFAFRAAPRPASPSNAVPIDGATAAAASDLARREELTLWESIKDSASVAVFEDYLQRYPGGLFGAAARDRVARLSTPPPATPSMTERVLTDNISVGTQFDVRMQNPLSSRTSEVEDRFEATTMVDLRDGRNRVLVPAGSVMRGVVSSSNRAGRLERMGRITVAFDRITIDGRSYPMRGTVIQALDSRVISGYLEKTGADAGTGATLSGAEGALALAGILIGGGGTIASTEGRDVELRVGSLLRVRIDAPLNLTR